jgi:hypothetical protein
VTKLWALEATEDTEFERDSIGFAWGGAAAGVGKLRLCAVLASLWLIELMDSAPLRLCVVFGPTRLGLFVVVFRPRPRL